MATACAEVAARLDYQFALIEQLDDLVHEAGKNLRAASDGNGQTLQGNGSGQTKQTDGLGGTNKRQSAEYDASAKSVSVA